MMLFTKALELIEPYRFRLSLLRNLEKSCLYTIDDIVIAEYRLERITGIGIRGAKQIREAILVASHKTPLTIYEANNIRVILNDAKMHYFLNGECISKQKVCHHTLIRQQAIIAVSGILAGIKHTHTRGHS